MEDYNDFLCRKNIEQKKHYLKEFYKKSKYIDNFRVYKNEVDQRNRQSYLDKMNQKMRKEDEDKRIKNRQKRINEINKLQTWKKDIDFDRKNKKREKPKQKGKGKGKEKVDLTNLINELNQTNKANSSKIINNSNKTDNNTKNKTLFDDNKKNNKTKNNTRWRKKEEWKTIQFQHQINEKTKKL